MPASISYGTPAGGGYQATVSGADPFGAGAGFGSGLDWIAELARRSAENKLRKQQLELKAMQRQYNDPFNLGQMSGGYQGDNYLKAMEKTARLKQLQAEMGPAPTKTTYVGSSAGFQELDPFAMNAYQRKLFLPESASFAGPSLQEIDEQGRNRSIADLQRMGIADAEKEAMRRQLAGSWGNQPYSNPSRDLYEWQRRMAQQGYTEEEDQGQQGQGYGGGVR